MIACGVGAGWLLGMIMPMPGAARRAGGVGSTTAVSAVVRGVRARARRLHGVHEVIPGRPVAHAGLEASVGGGW
jgi:hypothetical protein